MLFLVFCSCTKAKSVNPAIAGNHAPVISVLKAYPDTIDPGQSTQLLDTVLDADSDLVTLRWLSQNNDNTITPSGNTAFLTVLGCHGGYLETVILIASDGKGGADTQSVCVYVKPLPDPFGF